MYCRLFAAALVLTACCQQIAFADARDDWHAAMQAGWSSFRQLQFADAQEKFEQAQADAKTLGPDATYLTDLALGELFEEQGKYPEAEAAYRRASTLPDSISGHEALINILDKQGKHEEAAEMRKSGTYFADSDEKLGKEIVPRIRAAVRSPWSEQIRKDLYKAGNRPYMQAPTRLPFGGVNVTVFVLNPNSSHVVGYIYESSGDAKLDQYALSAVENLDARKILAEAKKVYDVHFGFNLNAGPPTSAPSPNLLERARNNYLFDKQLAEWQQKNLGPEHPQLAVILTQAASELVTMDKKDHAAELVLKKACEIWDVGHVSCNSRRLTYQKYGEMLVERKRYAEAVSELRKALQLAEQYSQPDSAAVVSCKRSLAKALAKLGQSVEAKSLLSTCPPH